MGFIFVIIASVILGTYPTIQEYILIDGASPLGLVILCNSVAGISALIVALISKQSFKITKKELGFFAICGAFGLFLTDYLLNVAYTMIPAGFTTMIHFFYPSLVCLFICIIFKERFTGHKLFAIIISIAGLICISGGDFSGDKKGILVALITSFSYCCYVIINDKELTNVPLLVRIVYTNIFVIASALVLNLFTKSAVLPHDPRDIMLAVLIGIMLCTACVFLNAGIKKLGAGKASFINMLEPITSMFVCAIVFRYKITLVPIIGCALIVISLLLVSMGDKKEKERI